MKEPYDVAERGILGVSRQGSFSLATHVREYGAGFQTDPWASPDVAHLRCPRHHTDPAFAASALIQRAISQVNEYRDQLADTLAQARIAILSPQPKNPYDFINRLRTDISNLALQRTRSGLESLETKVLASFIGKVESIEGSEAFVSLLDKATGERLESTTDAELLSANGISVGDEFQCEVIRNGAVTTVEFSRLEPKRIPEEVVVEVRRAFESRWK